MTCFDRKQVKNTLKSLGDRISPKFACERELYELRNEFILYFFHSATEELDELNNLADSLDAEEIVTRFFKRLDGKAVPFEEDDYLRSPFGKQYSITIPSISVDDDAGDIVQYLHVIFEDW